MLVNDVPSYIIGSFCSSSSFFTFYLPPVYSFFFFSFCLFFTVEMQDKPCMYVSARVCVCVCVRCNFTAGVYLTVEIIALIHASNPSHFFANRDILIHFASLRRKWQPTIDIRYFSSVSIDDAFLHSLSFQYSHQFSVRIMRGLSLLLWVERSLRICYLLLESNYVFESIHRKEGYIER